MQKNLKKEAMFVLPYYTNQYKLCQQSTLLSINYLHKIKKENFKSSGVPELR